MKAFLLERFPVILAISLFLVIAALLYYVKPKLMFDKNNEVREFGFEGDRTVFTYPVVLGICAVFIYLIAFIFVSFYNNNM